MRQTDSRVRQPKSLVARLLVVLLVAFGACVGAAPPAAATGIEGVYRLWNGGCMVPNGGAPGQSVVSWDLCDWDYSNDDQLWISMAGDPGWYELRNYAFDGLCLSVPSRALNAKVILATCDYSEKQQWDEVEEGRPDWGDRMLRNRYSGLCLVSTNTAATSDPIVQWHCVAEYRDQWWYFH